MLMKSVYKKYLSGKPLKIYKILAALQIETNVFLKEIE